MIHERLQKETLREISSLESGRLSWLHSQEGQYGFSYGNYWCNSQGFLIEGKLSKPASKERELFSISAFFLQRGSAFASFFKIGPLTYCDCRFCFCC